MRGEPVERWRKATHQVTQWVLLDDGPRITSGDPDSWATGKPFQVTAVKVVITWEAGSDRCSRQWEVHVRWDETRMGRFGGMGTLYAHQFRAVPPWLESILDRTVPRGLDVAA